MNKRRVRLISESVRDSFIADLMAMPMDGSFSAEYKPWVASKTNEQLAKIHSMLAAMADFCGYSPQQMKLEMKAEFLEPVAVHTLHNGEKVVQYPSFATMNRRDLSELIEKIQAFAFENMGFVDNEKAEI